MSLLYVTRSYPVVVSLLLVVTYQHLFLIILLIVLSIRKSVGNDFQFGEFCELSQLGLRLTCSASQRTSRDLRKYYDIAGKHLNYRERQIRLGT